MPEQELELYWPIFKLLSTYLYLFGFLNLLSIQYHPHLNALLKQELLLLKYNIDLLLLVWRGNLYKDAKENHLI